MKTPAPYRVIELPAEGRLHFAAMLKANKGNPEERRIRRDLRDLVKVQKEEYEALGIRELTATEKIAANQPVKAELVEWDKEEMKALGRLWSFALTRTEANALKGLIRAWPHWDIDDDDYIDEVLEQLDREPKKEAKKEEGDKEADVENHDNSE